MTIVEAYNDLVAAVCSNILLAAGGPQISPAIQGPMMNTEEFVLGRFLAETLPPAEAAALPFYAIHDLGWRAYVLGATDATVGQQLGLGCSTGSVLSWIDGVASRWGVPEELRDQMAARSLLGTQYLTWSFSHIEYRSVLVGLQARLDAELGAAAPRLDPIALQACAVYRPLDDDATFAAVLDCLVD